MKGDVSKKRGKGGWSGEGGEVQTLLPFYLVLSKMNGPCQCVRSLRKTPEPYTYCDGVGEYPRKCSRNLCRGGLRNDSQERTVVRACTHTEIGRQ